MISLMTGDSGSRTYSGNARIMQQHQYVGVEEVSSAGAGAFGDADPDGTGRS